MNIDTQIAILRCTVNTAIERIAWLETKRAAIEATGLDISSAFGSVDFDNLPHADVVKVMLALPGRWNKTPGSSEGTINYEAEIDGVNVRCWCGEPPPSCKIVEVEEVVPAQPETRRMVKKMICKEPEAAEVAA